MIYSNDRGSVIDSQETLHTETLKEMDRCKDHEYFYKTYCVFKYNGTKVLSTAPYRVFTPTPRRTRRYGKYNTLYVQ